MLETTMKSKLKDFENKGILVYNVRKEKEMEVCQFTLLDKEHWRDGEPEYEIRCVFCDILIATGTKRFLIKLVNDMWDSILYYSPNKASCKEYMKKSEVIYEKKES